MEYYDSINKYNLYEFYFEKLNKLLKNEKVIKVLDVKKNDLDENKEENSIKLFKNNPYQIVKPRRKSFSITDCNYVLTANTNESDSNLDSESNSEVMFTEVEDYNNHKNNNYSTPNKKPLQNPFSDSKNKSANKIFYKKKVSDEVFNLDHKLNKMTMNIIKDIETQKNKFEDLKLKRIENQKKLKKKESEDKTNYSSTPSIIEDDLLILREKENIFKREKENMIQSMMLKEIEEYIEKNMNEMHKGLDELKSSFEEEINSVDEEVFAEVVKGLREDMKAELEDLRDQYEEQRRNEIEKIRLKYLKKK